MKYQTRILQHYPFYLYVWISNFYRTAQYPRTCRIWHCLGLPPWEGDQYYTFLQLPIQMYCLFTNFSNKYWRKSPLKSIIAWSCMCILLRQIGFPALFPTISVVWYVCLCPEIKKKKFYCCRLLKLLCFIGKNSHSLCVFWKLFAGKRTWEIKDSIVFIVLSSYMWNQFIQQLQDYNTTASCFDHN